MIANRDALPGSLQRMVRRKMSSYNIHLNPRTVATQDAARKISGTRKYTVNDPNKTRELSLRSGRVRNKPESPTDNAPIQKPTTKPPRAEMMHTKMPACAPIAVTMPTNADTKGIAMEIFDA